MKEKRCPHCKHRFRGTKTIPFYDGKEEVKIHWHCLDCGAEWGGKK